MHYTLSAVDYAVIGAFFAVIAAITVACARKGNDVDGYFLAGRSANSWIVGLSFIATSVSSLSFLAFPAAAYRGNWAGLVPFLVTPLVAVFADRVCIPFFRKTEIRSAYEFLETRFGPFARAYGSTMFILLQIGRAGLILVLLAIPLKMLTGISQTHIIVLCGVFTTLYVLVGGLTAVMLTDAIQTVLLAIGGIVCVAVMCMQIPGGIVEVVQTGFATGKIGVPPLSIPGEPWTQDFVQLTLVVLVLHGFFNQLLYYSADQNVVQRYLAVKTPRESRIGLWIGTVGMVGTFTFFTSLGTCLWAFYRSVSDAAVSALPADEVFPHFILTQLPSGVVGLLIAAVTAAAMSSLDSNLNAVAMVLMVDVYRRHFVPDASERHYLRTAKGVTLLLGGLITLGALALAGSSASTLLDLMFLIYAVFAGALAGMFLLGMCSHRANRRGMTLGIVASLVASVYLTLSHFDVVVPEAIRATTHPYLIGAISNGVLIGVCWVESWIPCEPQRDQG